MYEHSSIREERIYLGGYEVYRSWTTGANASLDVHRTTLHAMDDQRRVAMVENTIVDPKVSAGRRWRFQLDNHLGTTTLEVDHEGNVISYEEYHPYGTSAVKVQRSAAGFSQKRYRYTGKERDEETGLYYHGARYYAPWLGRWTAADPLGMVDGVNLFAYGQANPVRLRDPTGTETTAREEELGMSLPEEHELQPVGAAAEGGAIRSEGSVKSVGPSVHAQSRPSGIAPNVTGGGGTSARDPFARQGEEGAGSGSAPEPELKLEPESNSGNYSVTIGIEANGGKKTYSDGLHSPGDYGHTYMLARDPSGNVTAFSFGPGRMGVREMVSPASSRVPARTDWPLTDDSTVEYRYEVTQAQFDAGLQLMNDQKVAPGDFSMRRNCTSQVVDIANRGFGLDIPNGQTSLRLGKAWTYENVASPYRLNEQLEESGKSGSAIQGPALELRREWISGRKTAP
ncbi:MAG: RHS repeat-associated core domain-containing protein [Polyangiaceae bacterium]